MVVTSAVDDPAQNIIPDLALNIGSGITAHASGATAIDSTITLGGTTLIDAATVTWQRWD
ncbi:MAG: hypothetical protein BWK79_17460 [Beggiatoa sp. IS2]|nr:MAG: hypothetical protein BWK79_17460 [Beggiatoa sp. IS2]